MRRLLISLLVCALLLSGLGLAWSQPLTATQDASLDQNSPRRTRGSEPVLKIVSWDLSPGDPARADNWRVVVQFDLSGVVASTVTSATLFVCLDKLSTGRSVRFYDAHPVLTPWDQGTVTWTFPWTTPGGDIGPPTDTAPVCKQFLKPKGQPEPCAEPLTNNPDRFIAWDVTADVQAGTAGNGWLIKDAQEDGAFEKSEWVATESPATVCGPNSAPQLVLNAPPPPPPGPPPAP